MRQELTMRNQIFASLFRGAYGKPPIPPLASPSPSAIPSKSLQVLLYQDGSLVSAHSAKSSPIVVSPAANLPTILALESSSLSVMVSSLMIKIVKMKNSSEPALPAVANLEKIGIAVTLGNSVAPPVSDTTTTQDAVVYVDGFFSENKEEAKSAFKTLLESANFRSDCQLPVAESSGQLGDYERCSHLKKIERLEIFQEYIRDLESEEKEQRKLGMIKDFAAYLAVSSNTSGSISKDLFTDMLDELEKQYLDDKSQIKDAIRMAEIRLTSAWTLDDFKVAIEKYIIMMISSMPALCLVHQQILNDDDILDASVVSSMSTDILNVDNILDDSVVSNTSIAIE
ncbi:hypothetical protein CQW23_18528 [Capsicum baccatum]|uniref:FF domain-containing protein n=1 Tax=Capsicum baccatum TaxID=33114 RepID=A0A2G2W373_CAPBA|nr:hypothetical protein CQW23_18528 [Capsicum baccatum]